MTKFLITPSLLNSYSYYIGDDYKSPADSRADFLKTLSREKFEPNEAMQRGIFFENQVQKCCNFKGIPVFLMGEPSPYEKTVIGIADIVRDGLWQQSVKKEIKVGNQEFLLYGRTDVIKRDTVYDIKFTSNYELGKFLDSSQHLIYLYCSDLPNFSYLISDGKEFWREDYHNHAGIENEIKSKISDFLGYLENDKEAKEMFLTKWESKNNNNA
jgi:hypothetical protein